ncbi:putative Hsp70 nucleotide exchange factor [Lindgomyces ingoldianus]|uniref:Hsp70 nucleotide exchange factor n=1 Tax=Lindgomyces ingoldianus TaxID=673940 RepID=A0ACB6QVY4_9PLEO|nr:putative Hsp70 nucleotide exchange factor [Lindgomyces ingoldianus]KAF2471164.1 putative Hsp70 nucleotide exchange factor [Lindgomyces ingoldianus]
MNDPRLNNLFKWGVENSDASRNDPTANTGSRTQLDPEALKQVLFPSSGSGQGPRSDPEWMTHYMDVVSNKDPTATEKAQALEHFEELIANLDNANSMTLAHWNALVEELKNEDRDVRLWAAWCCDTAVQNNVKTQERLLGVGAIPVLSKMATEDKDKDVRKKAIKALSSAVTNFQPSLDATVDNMPAEFRPSGKLDASDMDSVNTLIGKLRDSNK